MDRGNDNQAQDVTEMTEEQRAGLAQRAAQQLELGKQILPNGDNTLTLSALTEAAYLYVGLHDEAAGDALSTLVNFVQSLGEQAFDTATAELDDDHRGMLDQIVSLLQQMDADEDGDDGDGEDEQEVTPEQREQLMERARQQLQEGRTAASNEEIVPALNSFVEAAAIYLALDDEHKEDALAGFVGVLQTVPPNNLNVYVAQMDQQHQRWMLGLMNLLQQRTVQEHGPEIRASAQVSLAQAEQAVTTSDHTAALQSYSEAFSNAASIQDDELSNQILTSFGAMADDIGPGAIGTASQGLDERGKVAFQMLLMGLGEMRDPSNRRQP